MAITVETRPDGTLLFTGDEDGDILIGGLGDDELNSFGANSTLDGGPGIDLLISLGGDSTLIGGSGNDTLISFSANDTVSYANDPSNDPAGVVGVVVDLSNISADGTISVIDGTGGTDTLFGIENVTGSAFADRLAGDSFANALSGGAGNDTLRGGLGNDMIDGGAGVDLLDFSDATASVNFTLVQSATDTTVAAGATPGLGQDIYRNMEGVIGSAFDDTLTGSSGNDTLDGGAGNDVFKYSFDLTRGDGVTFSFTKFFLANGGFLENGEVADGTSQGQFSSLYTKWLEMLIQDHGLGTSVLDLGQNAGINGTPVIENMTGEFGERESFEWTSGSAKKPVTHERWYSDTWSSGDGGDAVKSGDGLDTILDFTWGEDKLDFSGITQRQFLDFFNVDFTEDVNGDFKADTVIKINEFDDWSITLSDFSGYGLADFASDSMFS